MTFNHSSYTVFVAAVIGCIASCSPKAPTITMDGTATANSEVETLFQQSRSRFDAGDIGAADEGFAAILREFPGDPLARSATIYRARIALKLDNPERARKLLAPIKGDKDPTAERALLYDAAALSVLGRDAEAAAALNTLVDRLTDREDIIVLETTLWNAAQKINDVARAAASVDRLAAVQEDASAKRDVLRTFKRSLAAFTDIALLERTIQSLGRKSETRPLIENRIAELYLDSGQYQAAQKILDRLDRNTDVEKEFSTNTTAMPAEDVDLTAVGVLVPLSGRARLVGEAALKGAQLAAREAGVVLKIRDSKSTPETTTAAVEDLIVNDRVAAIVGPLDSQAAEAAAQKAQSLGVPILLLSPREDTTAVGDFVFREFAGNRIEPEILVAIAKARGLKRCAVLFPDTGYGRGMRALFVAALKSAGMTLVGEAMYGAEAVSFKEQAEALAKTAPDLLFLPDQASKIALIAPALAAAGLQSVAEGEQAAESGLPIQLLIPSVGFADDLFRRAGRYLNGALFSVFFSPDLQPTNNRFAAEFYLEYGTRPNLVAAYGYDAVLIVGKGLHSGVENRKDLRRWLIDSAASAAPALGTAAPFSGFTANGAPTALPHILELINGNLNILDPNEIQAVAGPVQPEQSLLLKR